MSLRAWRLAAANVRSFRPLPCWQTLRVHVYNRFGAFNPGGMLYALRRDVVVASDQSDTGVAGLDDDVAFPVAADADVDKALAGNVRLRADKWPTPIVLGVNEGDCLPIEFTNLLDPDRDGEEHVVDPATGCEISVGSDEPATRAASIHVNGLEPSGSISSDGTNVGYMQHRWQYRARHGSIR